MAKRGILVVFLALFLVSFASAGNVIFKDGGIIGGDVEIASNWINTSLGQDLWFNQKVRPLSMQAGLTTYAGSNIWSIGTFNMNNAFKVTGSNSLYLGNNVNCLNFAGIMLCDASSGYSFLHNGEGLTITNVSVNYGSLTGTDSVNAVHTVDNTLAWATNGNTFMNWTEDEVNVSANLTIDEDDTYLCFGEDRDACIFWDGNDLQFDTNVTTSGQAIFSGDIVAENYIDLSYVYDKSLGDSLDHTRDSDTLRDGDGRHNDSKYPDFIRAEIEVVDRDRPVEIIKYRMIRVDSRLDKGGFEDCMNATNNTQEDLCNSYYQIPIYENQSYVEVVYPYTKIIHGRDMSVLIGLHDQQIYDLLVRIEKLETRISQLEGN